MSGLGSGSSPSRCSSSRATSDAVGFCQGREDAAAGAAAHVGGPPGIGRRRDAVRVGFAAGRETAVGSSVPAAAAAAAAGTRPVAVAAAGVWTAFPEPGSSSDGTLDHIPDIFHVVRCIALVYCVSGRVRSCLC